MNVTHPNYGQNYQLTRAALRLGTFTASELEDLTGAAKNTIYGFVSKLRQAGEDMLTAEELQSLRGRPQKRYSLTEAGTKYLAELSFELASRFADDVDAQSARAQAEESILLPSDIYEEDQELLVQVEVPGLSKNDVNVWIEEHELVVSGQRPPFYQRRGATPYMTERQHGRFKRAFPLPRSVEARIRTVDVKDGILEVVVEKTAIGSVRCGHIRVQEGVAEGRTQDANAAMAHQSLEEMA